MRRTVFFFIHSVYLDCVEAEFVLVLVRQSRRHSGEHSCWSSGTLWLCQHPGEGGREGERERGREGGKEGGREGDR